MVSGARLHRYTYREYLSLEHAANVRIPSLREVVLVAYDERLVEVWRREAEDVWVRREARSGALQLTAVPATLSVDDVYRDELAAT